jgi:hypothetical protein
MPSPSTSHNSSSNVFVARAAEEDREFQIIGRVIPTAEEISIEDICKGMEAAEKAQQQLLITGRFAEAAKQGNTVVSDLFGAYSTLQQLYHKAIRTLLKQYGQLAVVPAGGCSTCC